MVVPPHHLNHNIASSLALYTYLARSTQMRCKGEMMDFCVSSLIRVVLGVLSHREFVAGDVVDLGTGSITVHGDGQVSGFKACLSNGVHLSVQRLLKDEP